MTIPIPGTLHTAADQAREDRVARILEAAYGVTIHRMPPLYPLDWYAERNADVRFWAELKSSPTHNIGDYPMALLSMVKYDALMSHACRTGRPGLFVKGWADGSVRALDVRQINPYMPRVTGRTDRGRQFDQEPMIPVAVDRMDVVCGPGTP